MATTEIILQVKLRGIENRVRFNFHDDERLGTSADVFVARIAKAPTPHRTHGVARRFADLAEVLAAGYQVGETTSVGTGYAVMLPRTTILGRDAEVLAFA